MMRDVMGEITGRPFDLLIGRRTYDFFAGHWPNVVDDPGAKQLNDATKNVVSASHPTLEWGPAERIEGDVPARISAIKKGDGPELQVHGSGTLIQTLLRHDLVDRFHVWVFPVLIGSGNRLFADGTVPSGLKVVDSRTSSTGVVISTLEPTGALVTGTFAPAG
jgi:dihydrofolate reductase